MTPTDQELQRLAEAVASCLLLREMTLACAESCTGGWIAKVCTDLPGSSVWFDRGFVTYSNLSKSQMLSIGSKTIERDGAVSVAVARQMAEGALREARTDVAVAVTGIAGPDGGTESKPVGTVWFAWTMKGKKIVTEMQVFEGDRESIRRATVAHALVGIVTMVGRHTQLT
jgi:nicotinamide-nucleotide amidase